MDDTLWHRIQLTDKHVRPRYTALSQGFTNLFLIPVHFCRINMAIQPVLVSRSSYHSPVLMILTGIHASMLPSKQVCSRRSDILPAQVVG